MRASFGPDIYGQGYTLRWHIIKKSCIPLDFDALHGLLLQLETLWVRGTFDIKFEYQIDISPPSTYQHI